MSCGHCLEEMEQARAERDEQLRAFYQKQVAENTDDFNVQEFIPDSDDAPAKPAKTTKKASKK